MPISRLLPLLVFFSVQPNQQSLGSELEEAMGRKSPAILIIGSGISGIGAAEKLYQNGFRNIRILEATGRTGGRIQTQSFGNTVGSHCWRTISSHRRLSSYCVLRYSRGSTNRQCPLEGSADTPDTRQSQRTQNYSMNWNLFTPVF